MVTSLSDQSMGCNELLAPLMLLMLQNVAVRLVSGDAVVGNAVVRQRILISHSMLFQVILHLLQVVQLLLVAASLITVDTVTIMEVVWRNSISFRQSLVIMLPERVHKVEQIGLIGEINHFIALLGRQFHSTTQSIVPGVLLFYLIRMVSSMRHR